MITYKKWLRKYRADIAMSLFILLIPFAVYIHVFFENQGSMIQVFGRTYEISYGDFGAFLWTILVHIVPVGLCILWFYSNPYHWRWAILSPIGLYFYSLLKNFIYFPESIEANIEVFSASLTFLIFFILYLTDRFYFERLKLRELGQFSERLFQEGFLHSELKNQMSQIASLKIDSEKEYLLKSTVVAENLKDYFRKLRSKKLNMWNELRNIDVFIMIILLLHPVIFNFHNVIPAGVQNYEVLGWKIGSNGFEDATTLVWYVFIKVFILIPLFIWFLTSKNWWRYAILSPIIVFSFQLWEGVKESNSKVDENEYLEALPFLAVIVGVLMILSYLISYRPKLARMYDELSQDLDRIISEIGNREIQKESREVLLANSHGAIKTKREAKKHLQNLFELKQELLEQLEKKSS